MRSREHASQDPTASGIKHATESSIESVTGHGNTSDTTVRFDQEYEVSYMTKNPNPNHDPYEVDTIKANAAIARKFFEIETNILSISNYKDFFEQLFTQIEEKFAIPHVWISIINGSKVSNLIEALESSDLLKKRINLIGRKTFMGLINNDKSPILINRDLKPYYKLLPKKRKYFVKSLAVAPLEFEGTVIGSLNLGDYSSSRFQPSMDIFFLNQLSVKISICLSNITAREQLIYLASRDPLTHLLNRREMTRILEQEFSRAQRYQKPFAVIYLDCDNLKAINDAHGHDCGDIVLKYAASTMLNVMRKEDTVARVGGDEFIIILPNQDMDKAACVSARLSSVFSAHPVNFNGTDITVSISCGVASTNDAGADNPSALLKLADRRLFESKKCKKSSIC